MKNELKTLLEAIRYFSDEQTCIDTVAEMRWGAAGPSCPVCSIPAERQHWLKTQRRWQCRDCGKQYSVKVNTIFEDSPISLTKWLPTMWLLANCKNGVSSYEIHRSIGVTQKSAWFMLHRIRKAMTDTGGKIGGNGPVECDETFVGGHIKNMHKHKRVESTAKGGNKAIVMGMLERGGKVKAKVIAARGKRDISPVMTENVEAGAHIITDEFSTYSFLDTPYKRDVVNHALEYVNGHIHTNGVENFWSLLKRGLRGTYISVEPFHLDRYVIEQVFRYNHRKDIGDGGRFAKVLGQITGKRLTYAEVTGKVGETRAF